ncbi:hypothetical protein METBIDRAFT_44129 [Metschnikowia bicuspidata var. bicuspidata NRRL YB-4993]|uniref:L domain-like protein n=1 Tax=Metschnikowia bicuspidata var. bicuspidata NRRL YB-4993 TaxID=869754 RepID=A0A1A0H8N7_9ASCO|nr:hypothetical protein METBIDRAFT_44129 [Metschnikowia bicuspidata var. bicuspidata NRRL YB-4993]OBA20248.1 hypothetical protein METBIDRAFT_44129 [Metschnikowia bicuspidata var. bicuspidata NRRL YB-4993]
MGAFDHESSISGDVYVQRLASYIRRNEEALANGLLCFLKERTRASVKPLRPSFSTHHLYYITERIASLPLEVDVGPLNVKLDSPHHEHTFILFMANNARSQRTFESDARSVSSISSMKTIVSSALVYWMSFSFSKDPRVIQKDVKYLYLSFTKIPCLILSPHTKINSVAGYEEYPCDTLVPLQMFKNLQVLELVDYEPNEVYGWHTLSEHLRILIVRNSKMASLADVLHTLVSDDEHGRLSFSMRRQARRGDEPPDPAAAAPFAAPLRKRAMTATSVFPGAGRQVPRLDNRLALALDNTLHMLHMLPGLLGRPASADPAPLPASKWLHMKQLTVTESSITQIPAYVFRPLSNLVKLNLAKNLLEDLPGGLEHLPHLKYLNLADNYITSLERLPHNLAQLVTVNLNNNKITHLAGVEGLPALEKIDLRRNMLRDLLLVLPLVRQAAKPDSRLNNVFVSNNNLHRTYRADLFNLFNAARPKNSIKIDDSRPGYFERAMLLDPDSARRFFDKVMGLEDKLVSTFADKSSELHPAAPKSSHKHSKSAGDVLESIALLNIQDLENTFANRKHASVMTTASSTSSTTSPAAPGLMPGDSGPGSPSARQFSKTIKPLLPNANLCNQLHYLTPKMPPMARQLLSPMIHAHLNGLASTLKSSSTMARIDIDSAPLTNLAPNVITPVQVQVEGFH